jgi:hypothetical protein
MSALPEGIVTHAYLKSPNIADHPQALLWGMGVLLGDIADDFKYREVSQDPWKLTHAMEEEARVVLTRIFGAESGWLQEIPQDTSNHSVRKLLTDVRAFSRGGATQGAPAAVDTSYALDQQPNALVTYHFPDGDRLYNDVARDASSFLYRTYFLGKRVTAQQVEALIMPGTHRDHTQYPTLRWSVETYAFNRKP